MEILNGDLWSEIGQASLLLVTTNSTVRQDGALVMGRGAAAEAKKRYPELPFELGRQLLDKGLQNDEYNLLIADSPLMVRPYLGAFQVKYHWRDEASLLLIRHSAVALAEYARVRPQLRIVMNYPGIGNGRLNRDEVEPILAGPLGEVDNVFIYWR